MSKKFMLSMMAAAAMTGAHAQGSYALDPTFGTAGKFTRPVSSTPYVFPYGTAQQADGKIVVTGFWTSAGVADSPVVFRLNSNGTLDTSFGTQGYTKPKFGGQNPSFALGYGVCVTTQGKIAVAGETFNGNSYANLAVLDASGHMDASFNGGNPVNVGPVNGMSYNVGAQSSGKIITLAANDVGFLPMAGSTMKVSRYNTNGTIDSTFGTSGSVLVTPGYADQLAVDASDRIWIGFADGSMSGSVAKSILRLTANGQPDATWGTGGQSDTVMENTSNENAWGMTLTLLPNGKAALTSLGGPGTSITPTMAYTTRRFNASGHVDATYGTGGKAALQVAGFDAGSNWITVANGSKLISVLDMPSTTVQNTRDFVLIQTDTNGALDNSFGTGGMLRTPIGGGGAATYVTKTASGALIGSAFLQGSRGEVLRFKQTPTGIAFINNKMEATVFPNPAAVLLTLRCAADVQYALYDMAGREVLRGKTASDQTMISIADLAAGTYSLICTDGVKNAELRIVKR